MKLLISHVCVSVSDLKPGPESAGHKIKYKMIVLYRKSCFVKYNISIGNTILTRYKYIYNNSGVSVRAFIYSFVCSSFLFCCYFVPFPPPLENSSNLLVLAQFLVTTNKYILCYLYYCSNFIV